MTCPFTLPLVLLLGGAEVFTDLLMTMHLPASLDVRVLECIDGQIPALASDSGFHNVLMATVSTMSVCRG